MLNLAAGWIAIVLLLEDLPFLAIISAIIAFYLDCLDGYVARKTRTESEFGRQLDSTIDFLNYILFAAILFWRYILPNPLGILVGFVILATGAFRLIRFNIEGFVTKKRKRYYAGIVVCHISLTTILLFMAQQFYPLIVTIISAPIMLLISTLQASRILIKKSGTYAFWLALAFVLLIISLKLHLWLK